MSVGENRHKREAGSGAEKLDPLVNAVVLTIAPLYLGVGGVLACPERPAGVAPLSASAEPRDCEDEEMGDEKSEDEDEKTRRDNDHPQQHPQQPVWQGLRLKNVKWIPMEEDVVMCGLLT